MRDKPDKPETFQEHQSRMIEAVAKRWSIPDHVLKGDEFSAPHYSRMREWAEIQQGRGREEQNLPQE
jgi:hypothetical protein